MKPDPALASATSTSGGFASASLRMRRDRRQALWTRKDPSSLKAT